MENNPKPHLIINDGYYQCFDYKYPKISMGAKFLIKERNRAIHGTMLKKQLEAIKEQFQINKEAEKINFTGSGILMFEHFLKNYRILS